MVGVSSAHVSRWALRRSGRAGRQGLPTKQLSINVISDGITRLPILEGEISHVEIPMGPTGTPLGFTIVGGADTPLRCVVVQEVFPDGLVAQDGRLQSGDQIIEVDGADMTSATHAQVCLALRRASCVLRLGVYRERVQLYRHPGTTASYAFTRHDVTWDDCLNVTLWRDSARQLGIRLAGHQTEMGIFIHDLIPGSVAAADGRLHVHDRLLAINGNDVRCASVDIASRLLHQNQERINLLVLSSLLDARSTGSTCDKSSSSSSSSERASVCSAFDMNEFLSDQSQSSSSAASSPRALPYADPFSPTFPVNAFRMPKPESNVDLSGLSCHENSTDSNFMADSIAECAYRLSNSPCTATDTDDSDNLAAPYVEVPSPTRPPTSCLHSPSAVPQSRDWATEQCGTEIDLIDDKTCHIPPINKPRLQRKTACLMKGSNESLGMRIGGGLASNEGDTPIYVANIDSSGAASQCKNVKKGDILLSVNGQALLGVTHSQAVALLKAMSEAPAVALTLLSGPETAAPGPDNFVPSWLYWQQLPRELHVSRSVVLQRPPGTSLGFSIVGGCDPRKGPEPIHVLLVIATSPAAVDGKLRCGDRLLAVDGHSLECVTHATAVRLLKQAGRRVQLDVVSWLGTEL